MDRGLSGSFKTRFISAFRNLKSTILLCAMLLALSVSAEAQQATKVPRIGYLTPSISVNSSNFEAFRQGLRELGYVEGKNIVIEWRGNEGKVDRNPALAAELVRVKVDVIVAAGSGE
jgi:putative ABC transport system substrate-binding protein